MAFRFLPGNPFKRTVRQPFIFYWRKPFFYLMPQRPGREREVHPRTALPPSYIFVKRGDPYITRHCRQLTLSSGSDLFKVVDDRNRTLGLRVPAGIHAAVVAADASTKEARLAATAAKDARAAADARSALRRLFPAVPPASVERIVGHAFRKHSGRVGRAGAMGLEERVTLGVRAHVRHVHTAYEGLMRGGVEREEARRRVAEKVEEVVREWQGEPGKSQRRLSLRGVGVERVGEESGVGDDVGKKKKSEVTKRKPMSTPPKGKRKPVRKPLKRAGAGRRKTNQRGGGSGTKAGGRGGKKRT
ncbi:alanine and arginine rich protein [Neofusicoccum parvum]|uniref:Alanine and arginine rich protein n=1 Tax=Neofusicoccum parvum TaxID=310453 RepID=A0ACB5S6Y4_9PEZI|nr:alanine and arginine rich protein [Neofusicoccum parvum]